MSTKENTRRIPADDISEEAVIDHLLSYPDFFERNPQVLSRITLPHATGGKAVSLIERQVQILRQRNTRIERKLRDLIKLARANDALAKKVHQLALRLIGANSHAAVLRALETSLREDFAADFAALILFHDSAKKAPGTFLRYEQRDSIAMRAFGSFLTGRAPRCGQLSEAQRDYLFADDPVSSAALVPLNRELRRGFLAIGSHDNSHFHPTMSTDFLGHIGSLVNEALTTSES